MLTSLGFQIWTLEPWEVLVLLLVGSCSGLVGGMLGIGGAVINIPAVSLLIGRDIHLAQAAAMNVTFFVALPSAIRHYREGALNMRLLKILVPTAMIAITGGVLIAGLISNFWLEKVFGVFLLYVIFVNGLKMWQAHKKRLEETPRITTPRGIATGLISGTGAGILGIGGGILTVSLAQRICRVSLPQAIATSAALMCFTSIIAAVTKDVTLPTVPFTFADGTVVYYPWYEPLKFAIWLIPTAVLGSWFGAQLTHRLPIQKIRLIFLVVVTVAAVKMLT